MNTEEIASPQPLPRGFALGIKRGLQRRCPNCGVGRLFDGYIRVHPVCNDCGNDNASYRADDAPAWLTIVLIGHLFIAPLFYFGINYILTLPVALLLAALLPTIFILTLIVLPFSKGTIIGIEWARSEAS